MENNEHCVFYGNDIYFFEGMFDCIFGDFEFILKNFYGEYICSCFNSYCNDYERIYFPPIVYKVFNKWLIFFNSCGDCFY